MDSNVDFLGQLFPLTSRLVEKGAPIPFLFPETVYYEHHFPRGWYRFEQEGGSGGSGGAAAGGEGNGGGSGGGSDAQYQEDLLEDLRKKNAFLKSLDAPSSSQGGRRSKSRGGGRSRPTSYALVKRAAKECDSGTVRKSFSLPSPHSHGVSMRCVCVSRNAHNDLNITYLNEEGLASMLLETMPETCILSKYLPNSSDHYNVLVATWSPSVFFVEHRVNRHLLKNEGIPVQQRGDTQHAASYSEIQCCPLVASQVRELIYGFVWSMRQYEHLQVREFRAYFRPDHKQRLWLLWADTMRCTPVKVPTNSPLPTVAVAPSEVGPLWDHIEREVAWRKKMKEQWAKDQLQDRTGTPVPLGQSKGRWPSFSKPPQGIDVEMAMKAEEELERILAVAAGKGGRGVGSTATIAQRNKKRSASQAEAVRSLFRGTSYERTEGLTPMAPLSLMIGTSAMDGNTTDNKARHQKQQQQKGGPSSAEPAPSSSIMLARSMESESMMFSSSMSQRQPLSFDEDAIPMQPSLRQRARGPQAASSPDPPHSPQRRNNNDDTAEDPFEVIPALGTKKLSMGMTALLRRQSSMRIAPRATSIAGQPSPWRTRLNRLHEVDAAFPTSDTPRSTTSTSASSPAHRDRAGSSLSGFPSTGGGRGRTAAGGSGSVESTRLSPLRSMRHRARASVVMSDQAQQLELAQRLQYNELKRCHATALDELDDILYFCLSEELRQRGDSLIAFDLPRGAPPLEDEVMLRLGVLLMKNHEELRSLYAERFYVLAHSLNLVWVFEHIRALLEEKCHEAEMSFFRQVGLRQDSLEEL